MAEAASVRFIKWSPIHEKEKPFQIFADLLPNTKDKRKHNIEWNEHGIQVQNMRGREHEFHMDRDGFMTGRLIGFPDLVDPEVVETQYIPAVKEFLREQLEDVGSVFILDWRIRSSSRESPPDNLKDGKIKYSDWTSPLLPSNYAHVDMSGLGVIQRIQKEFPEHWEAMLRQRIRAINVWKPLLNPVTEWALAVCDGSTIESDDLVETDSFRQGFHNTFYYVKYNEAQKWWFLREQTPDEALVFKHFDSDPGVSVPSE